MHYGGLFEGWEIAVAKKLINNYKRENKCLHYEGFDDLLQECLIFWLELRDKYNPSRSKSKKAFMAGVVKNKLAKIIEKLTADKRKVIYESISLDAPLNDDEGLTLKDKIADTKTVSPQIKSELESKLSKALERLTPEQKELCRLISEEGMTINETCSHFNKHRSNVFRDAVRIRKIFEEEGLKDYLK